MADIAKIKRNIKRMIDGGASEAEIDQYIAQEGVSLDQLNGPSATPQIPSQEPRSKVFSGALLPISRYSDDTVEFDSDVGVVGALKRIVAAPSRVLSGDLDPSSQEGQMLALEAALTATPASPAISGAFKASLLPRKHRIPTRSELRAATDRGYNAARDLGAEYKPEAVSSWARGIIDQLNKEGRIAETYPEAHRLLEKLANPPKGAKSITLETVDAIYRELGRLGGVPEQNKAAVAILVQKSLDDFHANMGPDDLVSGTASPEAAARILKEARGNAAAGFRSDRITGLEKTIQRRTAAAGSGRNMDNQIRQRLTTFIESRKGSRGLTAAEEQAIDDVIFGKPTKNAMRYFGNLLGGGGGIMSTSQMMMAGGLGYAATGPTGLALAAIPPVLGAGFRGVANQMSKREVKNLDKMMRARSPLYQGRLGNEMPPQTPGAAPANVPLLPPPTASTQGVRISAPTQGAIAATKLGILSGINQQQFEGKPPLYGQPGVLFYNKRI